MHDDCPNDDDDPARQAEHATDPVPLAYVPGLHPLHKDPALEEKAPFGQVVHDDAPLDDDDPARQAEHATDPVPLAYVPDTHG